MFDDAVPVTKETEEDAIKRTLSAIGVRYSHKNDDILVPSRIEEERTKQTIMVSTARLLCHRNMFNYFFVSPVETPERQGQTSEIEGRGKARPCLATHWEAQEA